MNKRLSRMVQKVLPSLQQGTYWLDCYNQQLHHLTSPTIDTRINAPNNTFIMQIIPNPVPSVATPSQQPQSPAQPAQVPSVAAPPQPATLSQTIKEQTVLGWTRDEHGNVIDRHPVQVANCVTAAKRDNTQNYVQELLNGTSDGCASTLMAGHDRGFTMVRHGGHKQMGVLEMCPAGEASASPTLPTNAVLFDGSLVRIRKTDRARVLPPDGRERFRHRPDTRSKGVPDTTVQTRRKQHRGERAVSYLPHPSYPRPIHPRRHTDKNLLTYATTRQHFTIQPSHLRLVRPPVPMGGYCHLWQRPMELTATCCQHTKAKPKLTIKSTKFKKD